MLPTTMQIASLQIAIRHLHEVIHRLDGKVDDMQKQIEAMQEEWRHEYEVDEWETISEESEEESEESEESCTSAPATFSYKVQRTS